MSRRVLELGLADNRMGGGGDDCRAAAEAGRRADIPSQALLSTAQLGLQVRALGTALARVLCRQQQEAHRRPASEPARIECSLVLLLRHHTTPAVLGAPTGCNGPAGVKPKDRDGRAKRRMAWVGGVMGEWIAIMDRRVRLKGGEQTRRVSFLDRFAVLQ